MPRRIVLLAGAIVFAVVGALVAKRFVAANVPMDNTRAALPAPGSQHSDFDAATIEALRGAGDELNTARPVEFFLDFQNEQTARDASAKLLNLGFSVDVHPLADDSDRWSVKAIKELVPTEATMRETGAMLMRIAEEQWGTYDGWGCAVVRSERGEPGSSPKPDAAANPAPDIP